MHPDISMTSLSNSSLVNETVNLGSVNFENTYNPQVDCKGSGETFFSAYLSAPEGDYYELPLAVIQMSDKV